jgi:hypothetical protein
MKIVLGSTGSGASRAEHVPKGVACLHSLTGWYPEAQRSSCSAVLRRFQSTPFAISFNESIV